MPFHLVVLDLNLPDADGIEFLRQFRRSHTTPVIIVSARDSDEDKVVGLMTGADDFLTKPFSPKVLVAHALAKLRSLERRPAPTARQYRFGPLIVDLDAATVTRKGTPVMLAPREFDLLAYLVQLSPDAAPPKVLYAEVWGNQFGDLSTVTVHVQRLRKKLEAAAGEVTLLQTVQRVGYRANPDVLHPVL